MASRMEPMIGGTVYLNGSFLPLAEARISPLDRGFLFGDGVYEVIPVYSRHPFRIEEHLCRLRQSLAAIHLDGAVQATDWEGIVRQLVALAEWEDQAIYLQVTRGADCRRDHVFPERVCPTVFAMSMPLTVPPVDVRERGVAAITAEDLRWARCDIKSLNLLANILLRQDAVEAGVAETLLIRDGYLQEGTASNIFVVLEGQLLAPPKSHSMLPGITYDLVLELAAQHQLPCVVAPIPRDALYRADELWMTSSTKEVLAITQLDGRVVGHGRPGPLWRKMWQWYQEFKQTVMRHG